MTTLEQNIAIRKTAEAILELCAEQTSNRFWQIIAEHAKSKLPQTSNKHEPMSDQEAAVFERSPFPRGIHEHSPIGEVPCNYILWWTEGDEFTNQLRRYAASNTFLQRQEEEE